VTEATSYFYWLEALDLRGGQQWFGPLAATWARAPRGNRLLASAPNPFRPGAAPVRIAFEVATDTRASLRVYDVSGRLVRIVLDKKVGAERHEVSWNGRDERGGAVSSGIYFYRLDAGEYSATRSLVLLR
jgi:hypothetical protein